MNIAIFLVAWLFIIVMMGIGIDELRAIRRELNRRP
jgi:hypothetical protein